MRQSNWKTRLGWAACATVVALTGGCDEKKEPAKTSKQSETPTENEPDSAGTQLAGAPKEQEPVEEGPPPWADRFTPESGFPCEVEKVLAASCRRCHWEPRENDAPFSLVKWEDTQEDRQGSPIWTLMKKQVAAELMPPLEEMVDPPVTPLTPEQKNVLLSWLESGAVKTVETCE